MVHTKKFISFILVLAMVLSTMFAVSVPVFATEHSGSMSGDGTIGDGIINTTDCITGDITLSSAGIFTVMSDVTSAAIYTIDTNGNHNSLNYSGDATVKLSGHWNAVTVTYGSIDLNGATIDTLNVDGGTVYGYGTIGKANVNVGQLYLGYTSNNTNSVSATRSSITNGLTANGGTTYIAKATIDKSSVTHTLTDGIVNISNGAIVELGTDASIVRTDSNSTVNTLVGVYNNDSTLIMTGSSISLIADGEAVNALKLIGIRSVGSNSKTYISSGAITLTNGTSGNVGISNSQGNAVLGNHDDTKDDVIINVQSGGTGILTLNNNASTVIYDADITAQGSGAYGIKSSGNNTLMILAGPDTVTEEVPAPTVTVSAVNGTALCIADNAVKWSVAGGYKTAKFVGATALNAQGSTTVTPKGHDVFEIGHPLSTAYFEGDITILGGATLGALIPTENYYVYTNGNTQTVVDTTWEVQNALEANSPELLGNTTQEGSNYTYTLSGDIKYNLVQDLHGRTSETAVTMSRAEENRNLNLNGYSIDNYASDSAISTVTESALYFYTHDGSVSLLGTSTLNLNIMGSTGAYAEYTSAPGFSTGYTDLSSLVGVVNANQTNLNSIVVYNGSHSLSTAPAVTTTVQPNSGSTSLTITGAGTYTVVGVDGAVKASDYANLYVDAADAVVNISGSFANIHVSSGAVNIASGSYVEELTQSGGTLYTEDGVKESVYNTQVTLNATIPASTTAKAIGYYYDVYQDGDGELFLGEENTTGSYITNRMYNAAGTTTVVNTTVATITEPSSYGDYGIVEITGGTVNLGTGAAVYSANNTANASGDLIGVYVHGGRLNMTTGSSIDLSAFTESYENTVRLIGIKNNTGATACLSGGSISLTSKNEKGHIGIANYGTAFVGTYDAGDVFTIDITNLNGQKYGYGINAYDVYAVTYIYGVDIDIANAPDAFGIYAGADSDLIIMAGTATVSALTPAKTVDVNVPKGTALYIGSDVNWAIAGGYKTAVFTGKTALYVDSSDTPSLSDVHNTNVYALKASKPLTAGHFIGTISGTYGLDQLVPSESASHSEVTNYMTTGQAIVDLSWELKNVMEGDAATNSNYSNTTYNFPACINYGSVSNTLHGHYAGAQTATTTRSGITINLNTHYWTVTDGAVLNAGHNVTINGAGEVASTSGDAINHTDGTLTLTNALVKSENGNAVKQNGGDLSADNVRFYADTEDVISISSGGAVTISGGAVGALGAANKGIEHQGTGTLTILGTTITATGEAICIDSGNSFIEGATVTSTNNNAVHQKGGKLTITSGAFTSTTSGHGIWLDAGANNLTIVNGTFAAVNGYGLLVEDPADLTPLTAGTFSSVKNATAAGILYQLVEKNGVVVPAYTFRDSEGDLLSAWDLHAKQEITNGAIATFYRVNDTLKGNFTVVARPAYEVYYTSSEAITYEATSATALSGNSGDWYAMAFATGTAVTVTATAEAGYLVKDAAHMTYGAFTKQGCSFAAIDLRGDAANQETYAVAIGGTEDYVMSVTGAAAKTITLSAVENYKHGEFGYKFVNAENGNSDYTVTPQARVTASAVSGTVISIASGNAISLGFKPDDDHAVHESTTSFGGLTFTASGGAFDTKDSLVTGTAVINDDHDVKVAFCDMTSPVAITPDTSSYSVSLTNGDTKTINATQTIKEADAHYQLVATKGAWTITTGTAVTFSGITGTASGSSVNVKGIAVGTAEVTFTPVVSGGGVDTTPASVKWIINVVAPSSGGGGGGGGGGGAAASYDVSVTTDGSDIKTDKTKAAAGDTVTITVPEGTTGVTITDANGKAVEVTKVNDTTYTFKMPSSKVTVATEKATGLLRFIDVPMDKYFYDAVNWAVENGITTGTDATHFSPDVLTDRAQFVTFLWRAAGSPEPTGDASAFQDVASDKYYAKAVAWAIENGITNGLTASEFGPTVPVTRAHVVTFLYRFAKATGKYSSDFVDLKAGGFYEDAAGWAVENGITTGIDDTHFNPDGAAVRAQTITFLYRYFTKQ